MPPARDRHATVSQLREALAGLPDDYIICTDMPPSGNLAVLNDRQEQVGWLDFAAQDLSTPQPPHARYEPLEGD